MRTTIIIGLIIGGFLIAALVSAFFYGRSYERTLQEYNQLKERAEVVDGNMQIHRAVRDVAQSPLDNDGFAQRLLSGTQ